MEHAELRFLKESNAIERVFDAESLMTALFAWEYLKSQDDLSTAVLLETHARLMRGKLPESECGHFRKIRIFVGYHEGEDWHKVPKLIYELLGKMDESKTEEEIKADHIAFEGVHPFVDGNGRVGRMLLNFQRLKAGLPIQVIWEKDRMSYYAWFKK